jgi:hypothetical protein
MNANQFTPMYLCDFQDLFREIFMEEVISCGGFEKFKYIYI